MSGVNRLAPAFRRKQDSGRIYKPLERTTEPDVGVRIRRQIVQVQCEHAVIGPIAPIAAAFEGAPF